MYRYAIVACNNCRKSKAACSGEPNCPRCKWKGLDCIFDERSILKRERLSKVITNITTSKDRFRRPYVSTACNPCARAKVKCSGGIPCDRCSKRVHRECIYINKSGNIRNKKFDESLDFDESLAICSLCSKSGNFSNEYYQCEICINEFGLGSCGNKEIDEFLNSKGDQFEWIPYNGFRDIKYLSKGGFSVVYKAKWEENEVVLKSLYNSTDINVEFLKEVESLKKFKNHKGVVQIYGITRDPFDKSYLMVMKYVSGGNLYEYLKRSYKRLNWKNKIVLLQDIAKSLKVIHDKDLVHRDLHSGNIFIEKESNRNHAFIGDLGMCRPSNEPANSKSVYGVVPYIAPEMFNGEFFTKATDIYSFGMLMWELTSGQKPFANQPHNIHLIMNICNGHRPDITEDTPECFKELMIQCWDNNPTKRPEINNVYQTLCEWKKSENMQFEEAESIRKKIIKSYNYQKALNPIHSEAIYTSRPLNNMIQESISCRRSYSYFEQYSEQSKFDIMANK